MTEWDAASYHRLSAPQLSWGRRLAARLAPRSGERILDLGCGTGRLTSELADEAGGVRFVGLDVSASMLAEARAHSGLAFVRGDGAALPFARATFHAVFSGATFHWIPDHATLFAEVHAVLRPGGRLVAQCGGGPNLERLLDRVHAMMASDEYRHFFGAWSDPWYFASPPETRDRLAAAGFRDIDVSLEPAPTSLAGVRAYADFISCVCVRHHVDRLPPRERHRFVTRLADLAAADDPPLTLDYWRLNISATKGKDA